MKGDFLYKKWIIKKNNSEFDLSMIDNISGLYTLILLSLTGLSDDLVESDQYKLRRSARVEALKLESLQYVSNDGIADNKELNETNGR